MEKIELFVASSIFQRKSSFVSNEASMRNISIDWLKQFNDFRLDALTVFVCVYKITMRRTLTENVHFLLFKSARSNFSLTSEALHFTFFYSLHLSISLFLSFNTTRHIRDRHKSDFIQMGITLKSKNHIMNDMAGNQRKKCHDRCFFLDRLYSLENRETREFWRSVEGNYE